MPSSAPCTGIAAGSGATATAWGWYRANEQALPLERSAVWLTLLGCVAVASVFGVLGVALGAITRNQVTGIVAALGWMVLVEPALFAASPKLFRWLPGMAPSACAGSRPKGCSQSVPPPQCCSGSSPSLSGWDGVSWSATMSPPKRKPETTEQLRASLVADTLRVIARDGAAALTMRALAAEAGCAVGLPYKVFTDRHELVGEIVHTRVRPAPQ